MYGKSNISHLSAGRPTAAFLRIGWPISGLCTAAPGRRDGRGGTVPGGRSSTVPGGRSSTVPGGRGGTAGKTPRPCEAWPSIAGGPPRAIFILTFY
jgi:hypothetical protein